MSPHPRERDPRGKARDRRRRRAFLLTKYAVDGGTVCHRCGTWLPAEEQWHVDRFPVPGMLGGRYTRDNIMPACAPCNRRNESIG